MKGKKNRWKKETEEKRAAGEEIQQERYEQTTGKETKHLMLRLSYLCTLAIVQISRFFFWFFFPYREVVPSLRKNKNVSALESGGTEESMFEI